MRLIPFLLALCFTLAQPVFGTLAVQEPNKPSQETPHEVVVDAGDEGDHFAMALVNMMITIVLFIGLFMLLSWILKRMTTNRQQQINNLSSIKLLEQRTLSSKSTLYIIEIESERLLIGESAAGIALLASLSKEEESTVSTSI